MHVHMWHRLASIAPVLDTKLHTRTACNLGDHPLHNTRRDEELVTLLLRQLPGHVK